MSSTFYTLRSDGTIEYTADGLARFRDGFVEHGIDIHRVKTRAEHDAALEFCATEALNNLQGRTDGCSIDHEILMATMLSCDNEQALALLRERRVQLRRSGFRLVGTKQ